MCYSFSTFCFTVLTWWLRAQAHVALACAEVRVQYGEKRNKKNFVVFCRISEASLQERATAKDDMRKSYGSIDWSAVNMVELLVVHWVIDRCLQADGSRMWSRNKTFSGGEVSQSGRTSPSRYTTGCSLLGAVRLQIRYEPTHKP